jgi:hypothetical protein
MARAAEARRMTALVAIFVAGTTWAFAGLVWQRRIDAALEQAAVDHDDALDERDLEWVRIMARRDVAILAAVERWPDITEASEQFNDPAQVAEYWAETWRLKGLG